MMVNMPYVDIFEQWKSSTNKLISLLLIIKIKSESETSYKEFDLSGNHPNKWLDISYTKKHQLFYYKLVLIFENGASDQIRTDECLVHSQVCWASSPHPPNCLNIIILLPYFVKVFQTKEKYLASLVNWLARYLSFFRMRIVRLQQSSQQGQQSTTTNQGRRR